MNKKVYKTHHANLNVNLTVKNVIQIKFWTTINIDVEWKSKKNCVQKRLYLESC